MPYKKPKKKSSTQGVVKKSKANVKRQQSAASVIAALKRESKPYAGQTKLLRPGDVRRQIQGSNEFVRGTKRKQLMNSSANCPRAPGQTFLEQHAVSPRTAMDYRFRLALFHRFCHLNRLSLGRASQVDCHLVIFLEQCFKDGMDLAEATKFLAAVLDQRPELSPRNQLPRSRRALKGWKNLDPGSSRPPLAFPIIALIALRLWQAKHRSAALFVLTMFVTYCRPFELLKLERKDLIHSTAMGAQWSLVLNKSENQETSKMGLQDETMLLDNKELPWLGEALKKMQCQGLPLFNLDYLELSRLWKVGLQKANLPQDFAILYQLRHSGASWDRLRGYRSQLEVKMRGRWVADSSMARYEKHALVMQQFEQLDPSCKRSAHQAVAILKQTVLGL